MNLNLQILTPNIITQIEPWFDDPVIQQYIGDKDWIRNAPRRFKQAIGNKFRSSTVIDRIGNVFNINDKPIGYIETEVYDSLNRVDKVKDQVEVVHKEELVTAAIVYLVSPESRGKGLSKKMIFKFMHLDRFNNVDIFSAGTEEENVPSMRLLKSLGFIQINQKPDFDNTINWEYRT